MRATSGEPATAAGVVLASGSGTRVGADRNKVYLPIAGRTVLGRSLHALGGIDGIGVLVLVIRPQDEEPMRAVLAAEFAADAVEIVHGGTTRQESELCALRHLAARIGSGAVDTVLIHDAARPLAAPELVREVLRTARERGGAIPGLPAEDLLAAGPGADGELVTDPGFGPVAAVQTPQGFRAGPLLAAYEAAAEAGFTGTDTASCVAEFTDLPVHCIAGDERNFKITYRHDLDVAERVLRG
jgi:2-C-methyl-D-erythritol 4-phosphate cytidylyltransferase